MPPTIAVFGSSAPQPGDPLYRDGLACGRMLAEASFDVATGGYGGVMEAVSRGAAEGGALVYGVTAPECFPGRPGANPYVAREVPARSITDRIHRLLGMAAGFIVLDGSIGTLTELVVAWNVAYVDRLAGVSRKPIVTVGERWAELVPALAAAVATPDDLVTCVPDAAAAVAEIHRRVSAAG